MTNYFLPEKIFESIIPGALIAVMVVMLPYYSFCQEKEYIPDGTEGEMLEVVKEDTLPKKWKDRRWRLFRGKYSSFKFGGGFLYEFAGYSQDAEARRQMDSIGSPLEPAFAVRDFRLVASGQFKTKRVISWKFGAMYDGPSRSWFIRETGIMVNVPELWGNIFVGRTK